MPTINYILIAIAAILAVAVLLQVIVLTAAGFAALKAMKAAREYAEEFRTEVRPVLHHGKELLQTTRDLLSRIEPKLESAAGDLADITRTARDETARMSASAEEIAERIRRQAERMENISNNTLNGVERAGHFVNQAVTSPARQFSGIIAAARAIVSTLRAPVPPRRRPGTDPEEQVRAERQQYV
jgi:uncharacterized protein YoxC